MRTSPNRLAGTIFGAVYVLVGLLGFAVTSGVGFIATDGGLLLGIFAVNPLHNVAHLLIGAALLIAGIAGVRPAKAVNTTVGAAFSGRQPGAARGWPPRVGAPASSSRASAPRASSRDPSRRASRDSSG